MLETGRAVANIGTTEMAYESRGDGEAVLLLHAGIADSRMWDPQVDALSQHYRVIRPDLRGFGQTPPGHGLFSYEGDLLAFLDAVEIEHPHIVGASFGGRVAIDFALEHPARVRSLALIGTALGGIPFESPIVLDFGAKIEAAEDAEDFERVIELEMELWVDGASRLPRRAPEHIRELVREMQRGIYAVDWEGVDIEGIDPPAVERLHELEVPILVIVGDHDVPDIHTIADSIVETNPGARKVVIHDAAHLPNLEHPDSVNRELLRFLEGVG